MLNNLSVNASHCHLPYRGEALAYRKASPLRQRLPYKGSWREAPERARTLPVKRRRGDSIALTKGLLIAAWRHSGDGLALSVCFAATSPKGRGFRIPESFTSSPEAPPLGELARSA